MSRLRESESSDEEIWEYKTNNVNLSKHSVPTTQTQSMTTPIIAHSQGPQPSSKSGTNCHIKIETTKSSRKKIEPRSRAKSNVSFTQVPSKKTTNWQTPKTPSSTQPVAVLGSLSKRTPNLSKLKTPRHEHHNENCPFCQMPFVALSSVESPRGHVTECMDLPINAIEECRHSLNCDNTITSHYRRYRHTVLANYRAGLTTSTTSHNSDDQDSSECVNGKTHAVEAPQSSACTLRSATVTTQKSPFFNPATNTTQPYQPAKAKRSLMTYFDKVDSPSCSFHILNQPDEEDEESCSDTDIFTDKKNISSPKSNFQDNMKSNTEYVESDKDVADMISDAFNEEDNDLDGVLNFRERRPQEALRDVNDNGGTNFSEQESEDDLFNTPPTQILQTPVKISKSQISSRNTPGSRRKGPSATPKSSTKKGKNALPTCINCTPSKMTSTKPGSSQKRKHSSTSRDFKEDVKQPSLLSYFKPTPSKAASTATAGKKQTSVLAFFKPRAAKIPKLSEKGCKKEEVSDTSMTSASECSTSTVTSSVNSSNVPESVSSRKPAKPWPLLSQATSKVGKKPEINNAATNYNSEKISNSSKRCPFYKRIPDTPFTVDAFNYGVIPGCRAYFLSHFHYDHYGGLRKQFQQPIYCTKITANLVQKKIRVAEKYLHPLSLNQTHLIHQVKVTLLEANHCPGAVLFLFQLPSGKVILHTGDFRASTSMEDYPQLCNIHVDQLYLDTTYCDPAYAFPPQSDVVSFAVKLAADFARQHPNGVIAVGSYTIGKERIFQAIAQDLDSKIFVTREKKTILECLEDPDLDSRVTLTAACARVHVLPMKSLNYKDLLDHLAKHKMFDCVLALHPTGWTHNQKTENLNDIKPKYNRAPVTIYGVPYSEHSSYTEMRRFVRFTRPKKILPTVNNGSQASRKKMDALFAQWMKNDEETPSKKFRQTQLQGWIS